MGEKCETSSAREATDALRRLVSQARTRPQDADRFLWSADALDELARIADVVGRAVEDVAGEESGAVREHADQLATAIVAHRNSLLRPRTTDDEQAAPSPRDGRIAASARR
ncbi:hypothetical protein LQ327_28655 [Actinomycetospora endophytica]|uniref:Uncharacterized protein n=1 Tax=Actinomycetospora endophytica TaxID=2291215 RepID=A0ABS8PGG7_9PSEU|nr:hypothetical protein [Actinomycetospora endophytica]MCD2197350.1 hypothetical protein [Actinomycetospora endophytica]